MNRKNFKYKWEIKQWLFLCFVVAFIPRVILSVTAIPIKNVSDDVALLATPAYFAGYNWNAVVSNAGYYGFGFYGLFFGLFHLNLDPVIIFRTIACFGALLQALSAPICFYIMYKYLNITNRVFCFWVSFICSYMVGSRSTIVTNEHPLTLISWLVALLLCNLIYSRKKMRVAVGLCILLLYGCTIHTRSLVISIAVILGVIFFVAVVKDGFHLIIRKKWHLFLLAVLSVIGYKLVNYFILTMQNNLWNQQAEEGLRNSSYTVSIPSNNALTEILGAWFDIIFGQIISINILTVGIAFFLLIFIWNHIVNYFKARKKEYSEQDKSLLLLAVVFLLAVGGMIFGQSLSWLSGVVFGIQENNWSDIYAFKAMVYLRYFMPYIGPLMMVGFSIAYHEKENITQFAQYAIFLNLLGLLYWFIWILPKLQDNVQGFTTGLAALGQVKSYNEVNSMNYFIMLSFFVEIVLVLFLLQRKQKYVMALVVVGMVCVYEYYWQAYYQDRLVSIDDFNMVNSSYALLSTIEKEQNVTFPEMYVWDATDKTDHQSYYMYQYYFPKSIVLPQLPNRFSQDVMLFCNKDIRNLLPHDYIYAQLDENEYIYVRGEQYQDIISSYVSLY